METKWLSEDTNQQKKYENVFQFLKFMMSFQLVQHGAKANSRKSVGKKQNKKNIRRKG